MTSANPLQEIGEFAVHDTFRDGFTSVKSSLASGHVLEVSERQFYAKEDALRLGTARKMQGLHAPLRLMTELRACRTIGRLPCMVSSNLMQDTLRGNDDIITFDDIFNDPANTEMLRHPHAVMDKINWSGF
ncbi:proteasome maturation protein-like [Varroa jacobsoni]|uniref:Proteasome maturation protein n=1 Tax=Varroa destructor TaxID=109461 RepID=A0A7M7IYE8_VARDE|nr:proteasome maturation protein-like [Varroa destructor]XP_022644333.1 proteasome maturation protein-like [Varroa destructor]XP_022644334.1 proteasome maturation protein-like [Varroa destructor]XP_022644335.1 proteasome maturation protein-like [Varroa destructor]XP_022697008.1 proteasome maturation protein-like [Varroa jacobsoni]XP_022697009.1 proteasome maturation protein-like [Varroa jacobsoni]XP_022697010.1 proteasome maturation protein-like [Varroa jacobsoni]XP_022697011.1 proteasome ma